MKKADQKLLFKKSVCLNQKKTRAHIFGQSCFESQIIVPAVEENGLFMLGVIFLFRHFSPIENIVFNKNVL